MKRRRKNSARSRKRTKFSAILVNEKPTTTTARISGIAFRPSLPNRRRRRAGRAHIVPPTTLGVAHETRREARRRALPIGLQLSRDLLHVRGLDRSPSR